MARPETSSGRRGHATLMTSAATAGVTMAATSHIAASRSGPSHG
jgi:hypothetical protein